MAEWEEYDFGQGEPGEEEAEQPLAGDQDDPAFRSGGSRGRPRGRAGGGRGGGGRGSRKGSTAAAKKESKQCPCLHCEEPIKCHAKYCERHRLFQLN
jgi:hypothetical protein